MTAEITAEMLAHQVADRDREIARLQARLKACPTHGEIRAAAQLLSVLGRQQEADKLRETANRMEALNDR